MKTTKRKFTLVEMLVSMGILFLMMFLLSSMLMNFIKVWKTSQSSVRIYENAQMIFNNLGQDFKTAIAGNQAGREISIYWGRGNDLVKNINKSQQYRIEYDEVHMWALNPEKFGDAPLQVGYYFDSENSVLRMARSKAGGNINWNMNKSWRNQENCYNLFVDGISGFNIKVSAHNSTELPDVVVVTFTLIDVELLQQDGKTINDADVVASKRTFSRSYFLGRDRRLGAPAKVTIPD